MSGPNGETIQVLPMKPRDAWYVHCPKCGLVGWQTDDEAMYCPDDLTLAERGAASVELSTKADE